MSQPEIVTMAVIQMHGIQTELVVQLLVTVLEVRKFWGLRQTRLNTAGADVSHDLSFAPDGQPPASDSTDIFLASPL